MRYRPNNFCFMAIVSIGLFSSLSAIAVADSVQVEGIIKARDGDVMILQTSDSPHLKVLLNSDTEVGQVQGALKVRRKEMTMAALIPGLAVNVEGTDNNQHELVAKKVSFKGNDLKSAETIQAGLHETQVQTQQNNAAIEKQNIAIQQHQEQISANKTAIDAATARFGQLDDYYILDQVTIYFANGKTAVDQQFVPKLLNLAEKAGTVNG